MRAKGKRHKVAKGSRPKPLTIEVAKGHLRSAVEESH